MLDAAHRSHYPGEGGTLSSASLLTAALRMDVYLPEPVISLVLAAHPELLRVPDPLLPLALAAGRPSYALARWQAVVEQLLRADPAAARIRGADGRSALHEALRGLIVGQRPMVVNLLLRAAPEAVAWRDGLTGLPPGLLAAVASTTTATTTTRAAAASIDNDVLAPSKTNDPFNLLTRKQHQLMDRTQASKTAPASLPLNGEDNISEEAAQLGIIYDLLRANPLQIHA